jgi:hypothetical protein
VTTDTADLRSSSSYRNIEYHMYQEVEFPNPEKQNPTTNTPLLLIVPSVATVMTDVFQKNGIMVSRKLAKL